VKLQQGMGSSFDEFLQKEGMLAQAECTRASHLVTARIHTWPARASTLGHLTH
jgi:hypothetical protein